MEGGGSAGGEVDVVGVEGGSINKRSDDTRETSVVDPDLKLEFYPTKIYG
jgi:hypothetical protein